MRLARGIGDANFLLLCVGVFTPPNSPPFVVEIKELLKEKFSLGNLKKKWQKNAKISLGNASSGHKSRHFIDFPPFLLLFSVF